jgi:phage terminase large subunit-like protein
VDVAGVRAGFGEVLVGELDFRTVDIRPVASASPTTLHAAMIRGADATPWCIVVVATPVSQLAAAVVPGESPPAQVPAATATA